MNIHDIIKESLLNEVGEASQTPFRFKQDKKWERNERDNFAYEFKTKEGFTYDVRIEREMNRTLWGDTSEGQSEKEWKEELAHMYKIDRRKYLAFKKMGAKTDDLKSIWGISFSISDSPTVEETITATTYDWQSYVTPYGDYNLDTDITPVANARPHIFKTQSRTHSGYDEPSKGEFFRIMATIIRIIKNHIKKNGGRLIAFHPLDDRRARVFTHFILTQVPGTTSFEDNNEYYFLLNI